MITPKQGKAIEKRLKDKDYKCGCGNMDVWIISNAFAHMILTDKALGEVKPLTAIPYIHVLCPKCFAIHMFAAGPFGLIPAERLIREVKEMPKDLAIAG